MRLDFVSRSGNPAAACYVVRNFTLTGSAAQLSFVAPATCDAADAGDGGSASVVLALDCVAEGLLDGRTQREIAADEGVSASAISQRVRRDGLGVIVTMSAWLATQP